MLSAHAQPARSADLSRSLDTNILVRLLARDDPGQIAAAEAAVSAPCLVTATVLVETIWVLESITQAAPVDLAGALRLFFSLETVEPPFPEQIDWVLDRYAAGADFADLMHLAASRGAETFLTFDRKLSRQAGKSAPVRVETLGA